MLEIAAKIDVQTLVLLAGIPGNSSAEKQKRHWFQNAQVFMHVFHYFNFHTETCSCGERKTRCGF